MDNPLFPGGGVYLDDMPHVCTLCGAMLNNALSLQRHMQLHILSASANVQMLGSQPPPDPGIAANILMGGVSQHTIESTCNNPLLPTQSIFSGQAPSTLPPHLISPGLTTSGLPNIPQSIPQAPTRSGKEKGSRSQSGKSSVNSASGVVTATSGNRSSSSTKSRDSKLANTYISTFPKDLKLDTNTPKSSAISQQTSASEPKDSFLVSTSQFDPLEALLLASPTKLHVPGVGTSSPPEQKRLFQPFSTRDSTSNVLQIPKTFAPSYTAESLVSPLKTGTSKPLDFDLLSTPQKLFPLGSTDNLFSLAQTSAGDVRHFGMNQDTLSSLSTDSQAYKSALIDDKTPMKSQFYPGVMDQVNISPKPGQHPRKKDSDTVVKHSSAPSVSLDLSRSSTPESKSRPNMSGDFLPTRVSSPKISPALPTGIMDSDLAALPTKSHTYGGPSDTLPTAAISAAVPKSFGSAQTSNTGNTAAMPSPAIDIAMNPLGTGYFNALTSKLIDPTFSIGPDYNKPSSSTLSSAEDAQKAKSYFENGILINQDYDKISDTNDEDDLERLIETIDTKNDHIDTKGMNDIEELLSEFNDKHPEDMKHKHTVPAVDDFLSEVLGEKSQAKPTVSDTSNVAKTEELFHPLPDPFEDNQDAISELLEKEMEIIDKESKEVEKSRLSAVGGLVISSVSSATTSTVTTTSTSSVAVSTTASTSTITTPAVVSSEAKQAQSASEESEKKPHEEHVDFDIPKVGKLMKIRKYQEIQKRKEQTAEKEVEVKVFEKNEPQVEEKQPLQTILVQVSKRKKIEYGPYINKQSLLEGKPKQMETTTSPPKTFRPKPKPQTPPTKRTFNLRERRGKTDFATLAGSAPRSADGKKGEDKAKASEKVQKEVIKDEVTMDESEDLNDSKESVESDTPKEDTKIVTRNKDKAKKDEKIVEDKKKNTANKSANKGLNEKAEKAATVTVDEPDEKDDGKVHLRTRSAKADAETSEGKTLRKRTLKTTPESAKSKVRKCEIVGKSDMDVKEESVAKIEADGSGADSEEKITRTRSKNKVTSEIKKCSVNLGEKYNEAKVKVKKVEKDAIKPVKEKEVEIKVTETAMDITDIIVDDLVNVPKKEDAISAISKTDSSNTPGIFEKMLQVSNDTKEDDKTCNFGFDMLDADKKSGEPELPQKDIVKEDSTLKNLLTKTKEKVKPNKEKEDLISKEKTSTISQNTVISITTGKDKKVTMKFKLGPDFHKSRQEFLNAPKKRKFDFSAENRKEKRVNTERKAKTRIEKQAKQKIEKQANPEKLDVTENVQQVTNVTETGQQATPEKLDNTETQENIEKQTEKAAEPEKQEDTPINAHVEQNAHVEEHVHVEEQTSTATLTNIEKETIVEMELLEQKNVMDNEKSEKKVKDSVENEFQRLVNEAMAEVKKAQKEGEPKKQERSKNLRKRLNENVKYNVDDSDDEMGVAMIARENLAKISKTAGGGLKASKGTPKSSSISAIKGSGQKALGLESNVLKADQTKKDVDVYDFTDTEMSDHEDNTPMKIGFKPKYVSNLTKGPTNTKILPFVSTPLSPAYREENEKEAEKGEEDSQNSETNDTNPVEAGNEISYVGKTVEPLKIKLTMIKPFKEKKHKHKKKKKRRDRSREDKESDRVGENRTSESKVGENSVSESKVSDVEKVEEIKTEQTEVSDTSGIKIEDVLKTKSDVQDCQSVESAGLETTSNEGDDDGGNDSGNGKLGKKSKVKEKKHLCEYCNVGFSQKCDLRRHVMIHTGERPYPCGICDKKFQRKTDLAKHTRTHTGEKPFACEYCDKRVSDKSQLNVHRRLHTGDRPYQCLKCGKRCITSSELSRHKSVHCSDKLHTCTMCKKTFTMKDCLGMHMKLHYRSRAKPFRCEKCAIGFDKKAAFELHCCVDPALNIYVCSECYDEFSDEMVYADHIKTHDLGVLACNVCTLMFQDKHSLETHLCCPGMEKSRQLQCEICDLEFQDQETFSQHVSIHDDDVGTFMCDLCSEIFTIRKYFKEHSKRHIEEMPSAMSTSESSASLVESVFSKTEDRNTVDISDGVPSDTFLFSSDKSVESKSVDGAVSMMGIKQEVSDEILTDSVFGSAVSRSESQSLSFQSGYPLTSVKSESQDDIPRQRASVISGMFKIDDENVSDKSNSRGTSLLSQDKLLLDRTSNGAFGAKGGSKTRLFPTSAKTEEGIVDSEKLFDASEFVNSPDFSSLTEDDDLPLNSYIHTKTAGALFDGGKSAHAQNAGDTLSKHYSGAKLSNTGISHDSFGALSTKAPVSHNSNVLNSDQRQSQGGAISSLSVPSSDIPYNFSNSQNPGENPAGLMGNHATRWPGGFPLNPADYVNSLLSKMGSSEMLLNFPPKNFPDDLTNKSRSDAKKNSRNIPDPMKGHSIESRLNSDRPPLNLNNSPRSQNSNQMAGFFKSNRAPSSKVDPQSMRGTLSSNANSAPRQKQPLADKKDMSIFAQSFMGGNFAPTSSTSASMNSGFLNTSAGQDGGIRSSLLGSYIAAHEGLPNNFFFNMEEQFKAGLSGDKGQDDALLSNFE